MLYSTIANSQATLAHKADFSNIIQSPAKSTLIGSSAKRPSTLVIIPEELAPEGMSGEFTNNAFPLMEMSLTLSTAIVEPGMSNEMKDAFYYEDVRKINMYRRFSELSAILSNSGIVLSNNIDDNSFSLNGVDFDTDALGDVLYASALACMTDFNDQVTVIDLRSAYIYAKKNYGESSAHVEAVKKMINSVLESVSQRSMSFVLATNEKFFANQMLPDIDFYVVPTHLTASLKGSAQQKLSNPDTGIFQITLWFTIFICIVVIIFAVLTCGVGVDIEKDTLLYQTTALRGQPVL